MRLSRRENVANFARIITQSGSAAIFAILLALILPSFTFAADLPAGATAGGAQPILDDDITEPFVYPNTVPAENTAGSVAFRACRSRCATYARSGVSEFEG